MTDQSSLREEPKCPSNPESMGMEIFLNDLQVSLLTQGFPSGSDGKESAYNVGDLGSIPGSGRSPGEGHGNPLQCSCLENPADREA